MTKSFSSLTFLTLVFAIACSSTSNTTKNACVQRRAAMDMGSGATRLTIADVNVCEHRVLETLFENETPVAYRDTMTNGALAPATIEQGRALIKTYSEKIKALKVTKTAAIGTDVFRKATNGAQYLESLKKDFNIEVTVIDQQYEARLGYAAARSLIKTDGKNVVVWDVGGGSTQISAFVNGELKFFFPNLGSVPFKDAIIQKIQKKDPSVQKTPNPISRKQAKMAAELAKKETTETPKWLSQVLSSPEGVVYGIGGLHYYSIRGQVKPTNDHYTLQQVSDTLKTKLNLDDAKIGGKYASTEVSNLIMVKAVMEKLKIKAVYPLKSSLTLGLLTL